jgi:hypothetical protein
MDMINLSPEEILKKREELGGLVYDDPEADSSEQTPDFRKEETPKLDYQDSPEPSNSQRSFDSNQNQEEQPKASFGKSQIHKQNTLSENGWKNIPVDVLPTRGQYYPYGTRISIRAAEVREIRHFSTIDDDDRLDIEERLSYVLDRCLRMEFPNEGLISYKDLKQEDRFYLILSIRDLTFVKGENSILLKTNKKCNETPECPFNNGIELRTGALDSYRIEDKIMKHYNSQTGSFVFNIKRTGKRVEMFIPSIGVTQAISSYVIQASRMGITIDDGFLQISPFLFNDWRDLNFDQYINKMRECDYLTKEEYSVLFELSQRIKVGTKMEVKQNCPICGGMEVTADITFPQGLRSLFVISDIFGELL